MSIFQRVPDPIRPSFNRLLLYGLFRAPAQVLMAAGLASLIAVKSLNAMKWEVAVIAAALPVGNLLGVFWSRRIAQSNRKPLYIFWPEVGCGLLMGLVGFITDPHLYTVVLCLFLLLRAPTIQTLSAIMRSNYPPDWRSSLFARVIAIMDLVMASAGLLYGFLLDLNPSIYRLLFPLAGAFGILGAFQVSRIKVEGKPAINGQNGPIDYSLKRIWSVLLTDHRFARYELAFFLFGFANIMTLPVIPLFLEHDLGIQYHQAGFILATLPILIDVFMLPIWGSKLDKHNPLLMRAIFNVVFACGILTYAFSTSLTIFAIGRMIIAIVLGGSGLIWVLGVNYFAHRDDVPVYMGLHQTLTGIRGLIAPFMGVGLAALIGSYRAVFFVSFVIMNCGTLVMIKEVIHEHKRSGGRLPSYAQAERQIDSRFTA